MELRNGPAKKPRRGYYYTCEICGEQFYLSPCRIREYEERGSTPRYCSMECRSIGYIGSGNPMWGHKHTERSKKKMRESPTRNRFPKGEDNPNYYRKRLIPTKNSRSTTWRNYLIAMRGCKCEECGYEEYPIVQVHHIDCDKKNNIEENLILLCPNCHEKAHFLEKTGRYRKGSRK